MSQGVYAILSANALELQWSRRSLLGPDILSTACVHLEEAGDHEAALAAAFLQAKAQLVIPQDVAVFWVLPPDVAGILCERATDASGAAMDMLPFAEGEVVHTLLHQSPEVTVVLWVHANWVAYLEDLTVKAGLIPAAVVSRSQIFSSAKMKATGGVLNVVIESQGASSYLHAFDASGNPLRSMALPPVGGQDKLQKIIEEELNELIELHSIKMDVVEIKCLTHLLIDSPGGIKNFSIEAPLTAQQQIKRFRKLKTQRLLLAGNEIILKKKWRKFVLVHFGVFLGLIVLFAFGAVWQNTHIDQSSVQLGSLKHGVDEVQLMQKQERKITPASQKLQAFQNEVGLRSILPSIESVLPKHAYITRINMTPELVEFELKSTVAGKLEELSFSYPGFSDSSYTELDGGVGKYQMISNVSNKGAP